MIGRSAGGRVRSSAVRPQSTRTCVGGDGGEFDPLFKAALCTARFNTTETRTIAIGTDSQAGSVLSGAGWHGSWIGILLAQIRLAAKGYRLVGNCIGLTWSPISIAYGNLSVATFGWTGSRCR